MTSAVCIYCNVLILKMCFEINVIFRSCSKSYFHLPVVLNYVIRCSSFPALCSPFPSFFIFISVIYFLHIRLVSVLFRQFNVTSIRPYINIDVNLLTKGSDLLTYQENIYIFKHAFKYIKDSQRFTIV
jgi:hypothetical protein